jgi:hypothetical protein
MLCARVGTAPWPACGGCAIRRAPTGVVSHMIIPGLGKQEIRRIWDIDPNEIIDGVYCLQDGQLLPRPEGEGVYR